LSKAMSSNERFFFFNGVIGYVTKGFIVVAHFVRIA
jgi:hypothetical protein